MPWVISFIVSWILFFLLVDYGTLRKNMFGGLLALTLATFVDWGGQRLELYRFTNLIIPWFGCSAFYKFGPVLVMGILFGQSVPRKRSMKVLNILMFSICFISLEAIIIATGTAQYIHWNLLASFFFDIVIFCALTFIIENFLKEKPV